MTRFLIGSLFILSLLHIFINPAGAQLRRPISPSQPLWLIHIDTWNTADPERIIEMVPDDIRPYVVFNLSLSATDAVCCNGPDVCDSWLKACAAKRVWCMIQPASGSHSRFSDTDFTYYERYFQQYPNFIGWNFAEQFWGFGDEGQPTFEQRLNTFAHILDYCQQYGGYLVVSFTQAYFSAHMMPIAYMRNAEIRNRLVKHPENFICCEKYTMSNSMGVMKEFTDSVTYYLSNYRNKKSGNSFTELDNATDTICIYGMTEEPVVSWFDRGQHRKSTVGKEYADGVLRLIVAHNGPLDLTVKCQGSATGRQTDYTVATIVTPALPPLYTDTLQYEAECMDYKNIKANRTNGYYHGHAGYKGQGFVETGASTSAMLRDTVCVPATGNATMALR